jgi:Fe-S-cluster containining protein
VASRKRKQTRFTILDMPEVSWWEEQRHKPRFLLPAEYSRNPCATCAGLCCLASNQLTSVEATRMALTLALPAPSFTQALPLEGAPPRAHTVAIPLEGGDHTLCFANKRQPQGDDTCIFLNRIGDVGRCSAHSVRPGVCRMYPYRVELDDRELHAGIPLACPTRWLQDAQIRRGVKKSTLAWLADLERERVLVAEWRSCDEEDRSYAGYARWAARALADEMKLRFEDVYPPQRRRLGDRLRAAGLTRS